MASVVTLACDEKGSAEFGCRCEPKGAHSQRLHGLTACTECICSFFCILLNITSMKSSLTGVIGRGSRFPGQSTIQFASVVNWSRNLPISQCYQLTYCFLASSVPPASSVEHGE
jgi:hypothetical protein